MQNDSDNNSPTTQRNTRSIVLALLLATITFFSGLHIGSFTHVTQQPANLFSYFTNTTSPIQSDHPDMTEFWKVWDLMNEKFAAATNTVPWTDEQKIQGAIAGLVQTFDDPYTLYMPPSVASSFGDEIAGNFSGVGIEIGMRNNFITVIAPLSGTPAEKAGILTGDIITAIDGTSTRGMGIDTAVRLIRGPDGSNVTLSVLHKGDNNQIKITITRAQIEIPTVKTERQGDIYIITLYSFNALSEAKMKTALQAYTKSGAKKLVLDLRSNPGGYLQSAIAIASYIMPAGEVVLRENFGDTRPEKVYRSQGKTIKLFKPGEMAILIDGGSASSAEILSGALSQHNYATLIGENSFGKGSVQELVNLPSGAALKVTIAHWLTPNGTSISDSGIAPDITVLRTVEQRLMGDDPQMQTAIDYLHGVYKAPKITSTTTPQN